jgi:hypothetical protein
VVRKHLLDPVDLDSLDDAGPQRQRPPARRTDARGAASAPPPYDPDTT